jgi:DNA polymerase-4
MPHVGAAILHADLDAFYASVEQVLDPGLLGKPIAVGGGVVLAASYEAREHGVRAGMPGWRARALCPALRFVGGHFAEYQRLGDAVIDVLRDFTPWVERISIDEAFLDVSGSVHLFGDPASIATQIRQRVRAELGLPVSVGVATTKHLAKVASQVAKPDGVVVVERGTERTFLDPLPVELLWGVGPATRERLRTAGIRTVGELAASSPTILERLLGHAIGAKLGALAANRDARPIETERRARSMGAQAALGRRTVTRELLWSTLAFLVDRVATRLRAHTVAGRTVTVRVRFTGMRSITRSLTLPWPVSSTSTITEVGVELAERALADHPREHEITLLAVSVSHLVDQSVLQLELPAVVDDDPRRPGTTAGSARWAVDRAVDRVRERFGRAAVGYAPVVFREGGGVPDEFRELAEADHRRHRDREDAP